MRLRWFLLGLLAGVGFVRRTPTASPVAAVPPQRRVNFGHIERVR